MNPKGPSISNCDQLDSEQARETARWLVFSPTLWVESEFLSRRLPDWWSTSHEDLASWGGIPDLGRIGKLSEELLARFISLSPNLRFIRKGWVIQDSKRTIGEIDFLVETPQGIEHWELATKFYLYDSASDAFIGANGKDHLKKKLEKLRGQQLSLGQHPQVLDWCREENLPEPDSYPLIKGRLFYRDQKEEASSDWSKELTAGGDVGFWLFREEFSDALLSWRKEGLSFVPLKRKEWLSRNLSCENIVVEDGRCADLPRSFQGMLVGGSTSSEEIRRVYVVPRGWPDSKSVADSQDFGPLEVDPIRYGLRS